MGLIRRYPIAFIGATLLLMLFIVQTIFDLDIFEGIVYELNVFYISTESLELDELMFSVGVLGLALLIQTIVGKIRNMQAERVREDKLKTMRSTMFTVKDLVFNAFNAFQLVILEAEQKGVDGRTIKEFETYMRETAKKINEIIEIDEVRDKRILGGVTVIDKPGPG